MAAVGTGASRRASVALNIIRPVPQKRSSRSLSWTADDAFCVGKVFKQTTTDPVLGTCQGMQAFNDKMVVNIRVFLTPPTVAQQHQEASPRAPRRRRVSRAAPAQRAQNRRQEHVCFWVSWDEQIICKPPWGSVKAGFF